MNRRQLIVGATGAAGLAVAARLADRYGLIPPDHRGLWGPGASLTFAAQRLLGQGALAREYPTSKISKKPFANGRPPRDEIYQNSLAGGFKGWRLAIGGLVARPGEFSVDDLKRMPARSQITSLACEEGWNFVAEWTGVPLAHVLDAVGIRPEAKYVLYESLQKSWWDSVDMTDALHPQTLIAYGFNGGDLPPGHGGPLRLRVPRQLGYKSVKYITRLTVTDDLAKLGKPDGAASVGAGYGWYSGI